MLLFPKKVLHNLLTTTPLLTVNLGLSSFLDISVKLESYNFTGSIKDRAAFYVIPYLKNNGYINNDTEIIESSSGNFAISLSCACNYYNLKFTCVIDPKILPINEKLLRLHRNTNIIKVTSSDESGGYLLSRLKTVKDIISHNENFYWINQYANPLIVEAYKNTLGAEISSSFDSLDYLFMGVSSCGTIAGVSQCLKERFPNIKIIAVDVEGSAISKRAQQNRFLSGIGSSIIPDNFGRAIIDDFQIVSEIESIKMCRFVLSEYSTLIGGSSGAILSAINKYFINFSEAKTKKVLAVLPDSGERYIDTVYNDEWVYKNYGYVFK